jgi:hypothetical protein
MTKTPKWSRVPTAAEIAAFDGLHCSTTYRWAVANGWQCPCCDRTAHELIRWSDIRGPTMRRCYGDEYGMGFTISFAHHHCHGYDGQKRFPTTLICGDCNAADAAAKRKLPLPEIWSFSPEEIRQFVRVTPHSGRTVIDYDKAWDIFCEVVHRLYGPPPRLDFDDEGLAR